MPIRTERLDLIPGTTKILEAELRGRAPLAELLGVEVPESRSAPAATRGRRPRMLPSRSGIPPYEVLPAVSRLGFESAMIFDIAAGIPSFPIFSTMKELFMISFIEASM